MSLFSPGKLPFPNPFYREPAAVPPSNDTPRSLTLSAGGQTQRVDYRERRSARARRVSFRIDAEGLEVVLPQHARLDQAAIERAIREHEGWIVSKLALWQQRTTAREARRPRYTNGGIIPLLGEPVTLRTQPHSGHRRSQVRQMGAELWISGPAARDDALLKEGSCWFRDQIPSKATPIEPAHQPAHTRPWRVFAPDAG